MRHNLIIKLISLILVICLLPVSVFADSKLTLTVKVPDALPKKGEEFVVDIDMANNPGLCAMQFALSFDSDKLQCTAINGGDALGGMLFASNPKNSRGAVIAAANANNTSLSGNVASFSFKAKSDIKEWDFAIKDILLSNEKEQRLDCSVVQQNKNGSSKKDLTALITLAAVGAAGGVIAGSAIAKANEKKETEIKDSEIKEVKESLYIACSKDSSCLLYPFKDLDSSKWYHDGVEYCLKNGYMKGVAADKFNPGGSTTRQMMMTILARMDGQNTDAGKTWYEAGVNWAAGNGVSEGIPSEGNITREEFATMLYRYAKLGGDGFTGDWMFNLDFNDADKISGFANEAMHWCVMKGILGGKGKGVLDPKGLLTRAEASAMIQRFAER